jgi:hypothetical protein
MRVLKMVLHTQIASSTATLILISIVFLMLNIPSDTYFLLIGFNQLKMDTNEGIAIVTLFYASVNLIRYINNSINFLLYFISGRKFRQAAKDTMTCQWCTKGLRPSGKSTTAGRSGGGVTGTTNFTKMENISMTTMSGAP